MGTVLTAAAQLHHHLLFLIYDEDEATLLYLANRVDITTVPSRDVTYARPPESEAASNVKETCGYVWHTARDTGKQTSRFSLDGTAIFYLQMRLQGM